MLNHIRKSTLLLGLFALCCTSLLIWVASATKQRITDNERTTLLKLLNEIVPEQHYNNDLVNDTIQVIEPAALGSKNPLTIYRARLDDKPVAAIITTVAPDGYSGAIHLLVGVYTDGRLSGVRAIKHKETPGLGDKIDAKRSDWILNFAGKSLTNPAQAAWAVKKDGGTFDSFTGATITPRAVVAAVQRALHYFAEQGDCIMREPDNRELKNG